MGVTINVVFLGLRKGSGTNGLQYHYRHFFQLKITRCNRLLRLELLLFWIWRNVARGVDEGWERSPHV